MENIRRKQIDNIIILEKLDQSVDDLQQTITAQTCSLIEAALDLDTLLREIRQIAAQTSSAVRVLKNNIEIIKEDIKHNSESTIAITYKPASKPASEDA